MRNAFIASTSITNGLLWFCCLEQTQKDIDSQGCHQWGNVFLLNHLSDLMISSQSLSSPI